MYMRKLFKKLLTQRVDDRFTITNLARPYSIFGQLGLHIILTIEGTVAYDQWRVPLRASKNPPKNWRAADRYVLHNRG